MGFLGFFFFLSFFLFVSLLSWVKQVFFLRISHGEIIHYDVSELI